MGHDVLQVLEDAYRQLSIDSGTVVQKLSQGPIVL
jgi:hypothetical protein